MPDLNGDIRYIKGIGEQRAKSMQKLGINTLRDLISYFPRDYEDRRSFKDISALQPGETACILAMVASEPRLSHIRRGLDLVKFRIADAGGVMDVTFFNQSYIKNNLKNGESYVFYGKVSGTAKKPELINPMFEPEGTQEGITGRIVPIYRLTAGVSQNLLIRSVKAGLAACGDIMPEVLPHSVREEYNLAYSGFAYESIHFPRDFEELGIARTRLIFEEFFVLSCALRLLRNGRGKSDGICLSFADSEEFYRALPFTLTGAQKKSVDEAVSDMRSGRPMNRLVQGDVGSGKTVVAAACVWHAYKSSYQSAFMAPTEILAGQHYNTFKSLLEPFGVRVGLLTGSLTAKGKREMRDLIKDGYFDLVVGTHALISEGVEFSNLALVVADEQHRFGVDQRSALRKKGENPHVLVMSATPIPRTLALIIYGDLDISIIDEMPPGRQKVDTFYVHEDKRQRIYNFIRRLTGEGRQAYIVCPAVEDSDELPDLKSAVEHANMLREEVFSDLRIDCIHGKMKSRDKDKAIEAFLRGETDILVATTVIEVGVDVPNAAIMVVENAERFGLSQLHQLRGRVGRGEHKSYCILFSEGGGISDERLRVMCETDDGFKISEEDLKLRGPGDFFGSRQHGLPEMKIANLAGDIKILKQAEEAASKLLTNDPELKSSENAPLQTRIKELFLIED